MTIRRIPIKRIPYSFDFKCNANYLNRFLIRPGGLIYSPFPGLFIVRRCGFKWKRNAVNFVWLTFSIFEDKISRQWSNLYMLFCNLFSHLQIAEIPKLTSGCTEFIGSAEQILEERKMNQTLLANHSTLLDLLEIPQLMDTYVLYKIAKVICYKV